MGRDGPRSSEIIRYGPRLPELTRDRECGQAVDLWALGVLLYEMVTGESNGRGAPWHDVPRGGSRRFLLRRQGVVLVGAVVPQGGEGAAAQDRAHEAEAAVVARKRDAVAAQGLAPPHGASGAANESLMNALTDDVN